MTIRPSTRQDIGAILALIKELAEFEKLLDQVVATPEILEKQLFDTPNSSTRVLIIEYPEKDEGIYRIDENRCIAGFVLYFCNFSTFLGKHGIYIEDIYVREKFRSKGIGKNVFKELARIAMQENYGRIEWSVLNWNKKAIKFYESLGAFPMDEWTGFRLTEDKFKDLADE